MPPPSASQERFSPVRLARATGVTLVTAVVSVVVIRAVAVNVVTVPHGFTPLRISSAVSLTVLGVLAAAGTCALLNRMSSDPVRTFRRLVPLVLPVTFIPDVLIWATHAYQHTATGSTVIPLMLMHIAVALLCLLVLPALGGEVRAGAARLAT